MCSDSDKINFSLVRVSQPYIRSGFYVSKDWDKDEDFTVKDQDKDCGLVP